jgi:hypothetical protein
MQAIRTIIQTAVIGTSFVGFGLATMPMSLAMSMMPPGYTLSKTQLKGQHCYRHNNEANLYCYRSKLNNATMMKHDSMMKNSGSTMMKKDDAMMKNDSMMQKSDTMMKK